MYPPQKMPRFLERVLRRKSSNTIRNSRGNIKKPGLTSVFGLSDSEKLLLCTMWHLKLS